MPSYCDQEKRVIFSLLRGAEVPGAQRSREANLCYDVSFNVVLYKYGADYVSKCTRVRERV